MASPSRRFARLGSSFKVATTSSLTSIPLFDQTRNKEQSNIEKKKIEESAAQGNLSASQYLRDLGLGYQPKSLTDIKTIQEIRSLKSDMNKVGGLLKNLMNGELTDPKEIRSKVNGLLLDFSKNQNSIDLFISKVRSAVKF